MPTVTSPGGAFGSFTVDGVMVNVTADMTLGDPHGLSPHGVFPNYYIEVPFVFATGAAAQITPYDVQNNNDPIPAGGSGTGMYFHTFAIDATNLASGYDLHYDLYSLKGNGDIKKNAPFSHDAGTNFPPPPPTDVPEPGILTLLGAGLFGMGMLRRRRSGAG